jgi:mRNA interferase RelE/StbE
LTYRLVIAKQAKKTLEKLDARSLNRVRIALDLLAENPRPPKSLKLSGMDGYRVRVGDYRILYEIQDELIIVFVFRIAHQRDAYKD